MHLITSEYIVEEFLIMLGKFNNDDFRNSHLEITLVILSLFFVDIEHRCELGSVAFTRSIGIEDDLVVDLLSDKLLLLVFRLEIERSYNAVYYLHGIFRLFDRTIGIKLHQSTLDDSFFVDFFAGNLSAETFAETLVLLLHHLVGDFYLIIRQGHILVKLHIEVGSKAEIISECIILVVEIYLLDIFGNGLAENIDLIVYDIFHSSFINLIVEHITLYLLAETCAQLSDADMAFAKAGDIMSFTYFFEFFIYLGGIICFFDINDELAVAIVDFF